MAFINSLGLGSAASTAGSCSDSVGVGNVIAVNTGARRTGSVQAKWSSRSAVLAIFSILTLPSQSPEVSVSSCFHCHCLYLSNRACTCLLSASFSACSTARFGSASEHL
eukprot:GDKK01050652.1.p3 GENE.GDKK01050652.1~~GDKK01050652.1.p3  ORF type:complete len:109 (-),score=1.97 GDKK01050652.1:300-626(-)